MGATCFPTLFLVGAIVGVVVSRSTVLNDRDVNCNDDDGNWKRRNVMFGKMGGEICCVGVYCRFLSIR